MLLGGGTYNVKEDSRGGRTPKVIKELDDGVGGGTLDVVDDNDDNDGGSAIRLLFGGLADGSASSSSTILSFSAVRHLSVLSFFRAAAA